MNGLLNICAEKASNSNMAIGRLNMSVKIATFRFYIMIQIIAPLIFLIEKAHLLTPFCIFSLCRQNQTNSTYLMFP